MRTKSTEQLKALEVLFAEKKEVPQRKEPKRESRIIKIKMLKD